MTDKSIVNIYACMKACATKYIYYLDPYDGTINISTSTNLTIAKNTHKALSLYGDITRSTVFASSDTYAYRYIGRYKVNFAFTYADAEETQRKLDWFHNERRIFVNKFTGEIQRF